MHTRNQKLEGNVWEICVKSLLFKSYIAVFYRIFQLAKCFMLCNGPYTIENQKL